MPHYNTRPKEPSGSYHWQEALPDRKTTLSRSLSESQKPFGRRGSNHGPALASSSHNISGRRSRSKLRRATSASSSNDNIQWGSGEDVPPLPYSAPSFLASKSSLVSSESGHGRKRVDAIQSTPNLPLRPPFSDASNVGNVGNTLSSPEQLERRKASMSKLMRHFGESRIPAELIIASRLSLAPEDAPATPPVPSTPYSQRAKSLDLRPLSDLFEYENQGKAELNRARSLGVRKRGLDGEKPSRLLESGGVLQRKLKRARKITKIFGPEVTQDLQMMLAESWDREPEIQEQDEPESPLYTPSHASQYIPSLRPSKPSLTDLARLAYDLTDDEDIEEPEPVTPNLDTPTEGQSRRVQKLAKFFGVNQVELSPSILVPTSPPIEPLPVVEIQPAQAGGTEIDVQITSRRFWGMGMAPKGPKHVEMSDAIHQLRNLRAG
ncbi:hypothetical protein FA15DRAFT_662595 [Coprinopsis marcescibilis]|uniref:Uncharacterized protein n=1 Tax=Coprinopsis marcescibilis TaxID=230819 RepID=A0A5C3LFC5_COPMA|nr:hypothetical protein FA15DRAFT_662595 [Coprinopsis marcescibilis]